MLLETDLTSVLFIPYELSGSSYVELGTGAVNDSHPLLETNLSLVSNKGAQLNLSTKIPSGVFLKI